MSIQIVATKVAREQTRCYFAFSIFDCAIGVRKNLQSTTRALRGQTGGDRRFCVVFATHFAESDKAQPNFTGRQRSQFFCTDSYVDPTGRRFRIQHPRGRHKQEVSTMGLPATVPAAGQRRGLRNGMHLSALGWGRLGAIGSKMYRGDRRHMTGPPSVLCLLSAGGWGSDAS